MLCKYRFREVKFITIHVIDVILLCCYVNVDVLRKCYIVYFLSVI